MKPYATWTVLVSKLKTRHHCSLSTLGECSLPFNWGAWGHKIRGPSLCGAGGEHLQAIEESPLGKIHNFQTPWALEATQTWGLVLFHSDRLLCGQHFAGVAFIHCHVSPLMLKREILSFVWDSPPLFICEHFLIIDLQRKVWKNRKAVHRASLRMWVQGRASEILNLHTCKNSNSEISRGGIAVLN